jgi:hypothetical protein
VVNHDPTFSMYPEIKKELEKTNCNVIFKYISKGTPFSLMNMLVESVRSDCKETLKLIILDYLDLITSGNPSCSSDKRLDLGEVSQQLKNMAIEYSVPVLSASQLNRAGYDRRSEASLTQMSESMLKVNESDFILFLQKPEDISYVETTDLGTVEYTRIRASVLKNRSGRTGECSLLQMINRRNNRPFFNFKIEEENKLDNSSSISPLLDYHSTQFDVDPLSFIPVDVNNDAFVF